MKHFSATMLGWVLCSQNAFAETVSSEDFTGVDWVEMHGPEKPPPDDGYTFKGAKGGNGLGKLGLAAMGAGMVTSILYLTADTDSERRESMGRNSVGLLCGGFALLLIERVT